MNTVRRRVRETYARAAEVAAAVACGPRAASCVPHSGLGCGSPTMFAGLAPGEWVLDLGSGAGFDCLAAAVEVGSRGRVVGIDFTPEMVRLARRNATQAGAAGATFLQGEIERLPFRGAAFDAVISNCVLNLCADKEAILAEAFRVLKPGGRLAISDIVALAPVPAHVAGDPALHDGCIAGATPLPALRAMLRRAGFVAVEIDLGEHSRALVEAWAPGRDFGGSVAAANVIARKAP
jgi:SAM-dependent methyltransferase